MILVGCNTDPELNSGSDENSERFSCHGLQPTVYSLPSIHVMAGALFDASGRVLIAQRPAGKHMAGGWEFPGGKLEPGEDRYEGLRRELREEIGVEVQAASPLISYQHVFADRAVFLDLWHVTHYEGEVRSLEGQPLRWVHIDELETVGLLEADRPMIPVLRALR